MISAHGPIKPCGSNRICCSSTAACRNWPRPGKSRKNWDCARTCWLWPKAKNGFSWKTDLPWSSFPVHCPGIFFKISATKPTAGLSLIIAGAGKNSPADWIQFCINSFFGKYPSLSVDIDNSDNFPHNASMGIASLCRGLARHLVMLLIFILINMGMTALLIVSSDRSCAQ